MKKKTSPMLVDAVVMDESTIQDIHSTFKSAAQPLLDAYPKDASGEPLYGPKNETVIPLGDTGIRIDLVDPENPYQSLDVEVQSIDYWPGDCIQINGKHLVTYSVFQDLIDMCNNLTQDIDNMPVSDSLRASSLDMFQKLVSEIELLQNKVTTVTIQVPDHPIIFRDDMLSMNRYELETVQNLIHELQYWGHLHSEISGGSNEAPLFVGLVYDVYGAVRIQIYSYYIDFGVEMPLSEFGPFSQTDDLINQLKVLCETARVQTILRYPSIVNN